MHFFLPFQEKNKQQPSKPMKIYLPKRTFTIEDSCFHNAKKPYFSLPNPSGTVQSFLRALAQDQEEEALGYLSATVSAGADLEEMKRLFSEKKELKFFSDDLTNEVRTVSLACRVEDGKTEVISLRMIAEPNQYGKWKIYCIEKESGHAK